MSGTKEQMASRLPRAFYPGRQPRIAPDPPPRAGAMRPPSGRARSSGLGGRWFRFIGFCSCDEHSLSRLRTSRPPFPDGPAIPAADYTINPRAQAIAAAAERNAKREAWYNPPDLMFRVPRWCRAIPTASSPMTTTRRWC
jgi:hypothetical protein